MMAYRIGTIAALVYAGACGPTLNDGDLADAASDDGDSGDAPSESGDGAGGARRACPQYERTGCIVDRGEVELPSRLVTDYASSTFSFQWATAASEDWVRNDWDVLFDGTFRVRTVNDDESFIVDLGDIELSEVPSTVDASDYATNEASFHTLQPVEGHMYLVRTLDLDTRQWAAFRVAEHANSYIVLQWWRSSESERFVFATACDCR